MAIFNPVVRNLRRDGMYQVYIRITHNRSVSYLKTDMVVRSCDVRGGRIIDSFVNRRCFELIEDYGKWLNEIDLTGMNAGYIRKAIQMRRQGKTFTDFFREYVTDHLSSIGKDSNAHVYAAAYRSFEKFVGGEPVRFSDFNKVTILRWIEGLRVTKRAKSLYPAYLRKLYNVSQDFATDPTTGIVRMSSNPWLGIELPKYAKAPQRAVPAEFCRKFFSAEIPKGCRWRRRAQLGRDVAMMVLCLAGMNTADLFKLRKKDYREGVICYRRSKTESRRDDGAYFEMRVPSLLEGLFDKYLSQESGGENLLCFSEIYPTAKIFNVSVNEGIKKFCKSLDIESDEPISIYTFRHTWATIAQNECGATIEEVGFAMNHSDHTGVTRGYVKVDFSPAWRLNEKVVNFIFNSDKQSKLFLKSGMGVRKSTKEADYDDELISDRFMVYARAYFRGEVLAEVSDIGFHTVEEVIAALVKKLPDTIPEKCAVQFRIKNLDTDREVVYERTKGKGF